jgi:hypothetical protein
MQTSGEKIRQLLNSPKDPGHEYIAEPNKYEREIMSGWTMETVKYGFELDKFCPAKMGQLTCIIGHTNVGKTTTIMWLLSKLAKKQKKILAYSAENRISSLHKDFTRFYFEQPNVTMDHLQKVRDSIRYIKHERHFSYKDMLNQATYLLDAGFDFDFFFIDPYNALRIDNTQRINTHDYHYQAIEEMRVFTITTNKSIFLNCHTVTEAQRVKPDQNGCRPVPLMSDVEGGVKFPNKADDCMIIHRQISARNTEEKYITEIHSAKVRNQEFGGEPTPFDSPVKVKFRMDRTGFDVLHTWEEKTQSYKQISFYEPRNGTDAPF